MNRLLRNKQIIRTIIPTVIILLGLSFLFKPWLSISMTVVGRQYDIPKFLHSLPYNEFRNFNDFNDNLYSEFIELSDDLAYEGVDMDPQKAIDAITMLEDSKVTPLEMARISWFTGRLLTEFTPLLKETLQTERLDYQERDFISTLSQAGILLTIVSVVLFVLIVLSIISAIASIICLYKDRAIFNVINIVCSSLLLLFFIILSISLNGLINQVFSQISDSIDEVFWEAGLGGYSASMAIKLFHVAIAGIVCFVCSILALVVYRFEDRVHIDFSAIKARFINKKPRPIDGMTTCRFCGRRFTMMGGSNKCPHCGRDQLNVRKPPVPDAYCERCGNPIYNGGQYCPSCGHKQA